MIKLKKCWRTPYSATDLTKESNRCRSHSVNGGSTEVQRSPVVFSLAPEKLAMAEMDMKGLRSEK